MSESEIRELIDFIEIAEEEYWSLLWSEMCSEAEPFESDLRALQSEEHEGIFS